MSRYGRDPYWTTARFNSTDANGAQVRKGERIFYYPNTRTVLTGAAAEQAAAEFAGAAADEAFIMNGGAWVSAPGEQIFAVIENEPDHCEFPSVVIGVFSTFEKATEHAADKKQLSDSPDITWEIETWTVQ